MEYLSGAFFLSAVSIVLIDVLLAGDNAVVIAMAVRSLPLSQRRLGIAAGAAGAVVLRVILTFFAARILELSFLKLVGGLLIFWIAVKLLTEATEEVQQQREARGIRHAVLMILAADLTMSLDNILAVAAASQGNLPLLIAGLALSISFVMFMSDLLARVMDRYPVVIWAGAAILGHVAGNMILTDPWVQRTVRPGHEMTVVVEALLAIMTLVAGWSIKKRKKVAPADV